MKKDDTPAIPLFSKYAIFQPICSPKKLKLFTVSQSFSLTILKLISVTQKWCEYKQISAGKAWKPAYKTTNLKHHTKFYQDFYCPFEMHGEQSYIHTETVHLHNVVKFGLSSCEIDVV